MNLSKLWDRDDGRWSHPEFIPIYEYVTHQEDVLKIMFNDEVSDEEKQKASETIFGDLTPQFTDEQKERLQILDIPGCVEEPDAPPVKTYIVYPEKVKKNNPVIINIGGGGLFCCSSVPGAGTIADTYGAIGIEFKYRTTPYGAKYPAQVNDCHAVYSYLLEHAAELKINTKRIIIMGLSSGGHMALALCHRLKKYGITPRGCCVYVPCLDDRMIYPSSKIHGKGWASDQSNLMYRGWLGKHHNTAFVTPEMAPNHATVEDCVGLPATIIHCFANDIYSDPCMEYASKLNQAGVYCGLHMWPGSNHDALFTAANMYRDNEDYPYTNAFLRVMDQDIKDFLAYDLSRSWVKELIEEE